MRTEDHHVSVTGIPLLEVIALDGPVQVELKYSDSRA